MTESKINSTKFWSVNTIAFIITALSLIVSLAYIYYSENLKQPNISWSIQSDEQIFTVNNSIDSLEITYNGENLLDRKDELRLLTLNIKNTGSVDITESMYSNSINYGFTIEKAEMISSPEIVYTSDDYIEKEVLFNYKEQTVSLPHTVLDKNDEFLVKVLYFSKSDSVNIIPTGKISGINLEKVPIVTRVESNGKRDLNLWKIFLPFIILLYLIKFIWSLIEKHQMKRRRLRYEKFTSENDDIELPPRVREMYIEDGKASVIDLLKLLSSEAEIKEAIDAFRSLQQSNMKLMKFDQKLAKDYDKSFCKGFHEYTLSKLLHHDKKYLFESDTTGIGKRYDMDKVKQNLTVSATKFLDFLKYE